MALIAKRLFDTVAAALLLLLVWPLLALIAWLIRWDSPGPAIFRQTRVGQGGRPFVLYKFRTMRVGAETDWRAPKTQEEFLRYVFQDERDPRVTRVGRWLRRTSLDELPQLWNVLRGDMSLVGPRPEIPEMVALYRPEMHERHRMRPGLTGLAQVSGRGLLTTEQILQYDLEYCRHWSLKLDCYILWKTVGEVFRRRGAK
jgi:exopolysaccharide biosynthesis polyprenyl glycosylphosphotransferase